MKYCISKMGTALLLIIKKQVPKRKIRIFGKAWERNDTHMTWMGTDLFYRQKIILLVPITINKVAKTSNVCLSIVRSLFHSVHTTLFASSISSGSLGALISCTSSVSWVNAYKSSWLLHTIFSFNGR